MTARDVVGRELREMVGPEELPARNGELTFDAPWQGRVLGMAVAVVEELGLGWDAFRERLIDAIAAEPERPYYESWTSALESLVVGRGIASGSDLDARAASIM